MSRETPSAFAVMALVVLATVIDGMDASIVNVVLPDIAEQMGMTVSSSAFISVSYLIPIAGLCLALSRVADRTDIRRMFVVGTVLFMAASIGCAVSPNPTLLIASRFIQGLGAAFMVATTPIMVVRLLPETHHGRGMACIAAGSGLSVIIGPSLGGFIESLLSWEWIFVLNIPLGIVMLAAATALLPGGRGIGSSSLPDIPSVAMMFAGMGIGMFTIYGYIDGYLDAAWTAVLGIAAIVLIAAVVLRSRTADDPLLNLALLRNRRFAAVSVVFLLSTLMGAGTMYLIPYYLSIVEGMGSMMTGILLGVASVITVIITIPTGKWCDSRGCRTPACISLGLRVAFSVMFVLIDPALGLVYFLIALCTLGLSFGMSGTSQSTRMVNEAGEEMSGEAGSMAMLVNYVGYALGIALFALSFSLLTPEYTDIGDLSSGDFLPGFRITCALGALVSLVALVLSIIVRGEGPSASINNDEA